MITKNDDDILDKFTIAFYYLNEEEQNAFLEKLKEIIIKHNNNDNSKDKTKKKFLAKKVDNICRLTESKTTNQDGLDNYSIVCPYCGSKYFIKMV